MKLDINTNSLKNSINYNFDYIEDYLENKMMIGVCQHIPYNEWPKFVNHPILGTLAKSMLADPSSLKRSIEDLETLKTMKQDLISMMDKLEDQVKKTNQVLGSFPVKIENSYSIDNSTLPITNHANSLVPSFYIGTSPYPAP